MVDHMVDDYAWAPLPAAASFVRENLDAFCGKCRAAEILAAALGRQTGTRLADWVDHLMLPAGHGVSLAALGFVPQCSGSRVTWSHPGGLLPELELSDRDEWRLAIRVDAVADFLAAWRLEGVEVAGDPLAQLRQARIAAEDNAELWLVERHGECGWQVREITPDERATVVRHLGQFRGRKREFADDRAGFAHARELLLRAIDDLGVDWTCDLFFAAEREYWTSRNRAAQVQKARQDQLGLGWANHDHHTYRSSRETFCTLIAVLEELGFQCRERFFAGREAGWGAQVLEQPAARVVVFADVDLTPAEVSGDFAHKPLPPCDEYGTVGLWCKLHGEAFLQPGMHHLECRFDFDGARQQLHELGVGTLQPFTDLPYLKQAFTEGELWPVAPRRVETLRDQGAISRAQADEFLRKGAIGSHLEILERDDGYKGFNRTGINEIIRDTDPRIRATWGASASYPAR